MAVTPTDLYAFGNTTAPRRPRINHDVFPDATGFIGPEDPVRPRNGSSTFADPAFAPLRGPYFLLPRSTPLPDDLGVVADGSDVLPNSPYKPTHHTIYPTKRMSVEQFADLFAQLPWQGPVGRKR